MSGGTVELLRTSADQADIIRNLYQYYAYESSDWEQEDVEADGRFYIHEEHLVRYWQDPRWSANLILVDGYIAGFLLIESNDLSGLGALELADLFVLKKYRRIGVGSAVALQVLGNGNDAWLVRFYRQDEAAQAFWRAVFAELPRPVRDIVLDDEPELQTYLVTPAHH